MEVKKQEIFYIVYMVKEPKTPMRYFAVLKRMVDIGHPCFRAVGVWLNKDPATEQIDFDLTSLKDEIIPWVRIDHITNFLFKPKIGV